jgi:hypothetical protein
VVNARKALVGYATYVVGRRMAERIVRRRLRRLLSVLEREPRRARSWRLPVIGAVVGVAAAAAVAITRQRGVNAPLREPD